MDKDEFGPLTSADDVAEGGLTTRLRVAALVLLEKIGALSTEDNPA